MSLIDLLKDNFYISRRLGKDGQLIKVPKIRTMIPNAEKDFQRIIYKNGLNELGKPKNDDRIIPSRAWMRRLHVDEILQLPYNIFFKRNMRLVGIRPKTERDWNNYPATHKRRCLKFKPGLVGVRYADITIPTKKAEIKYLAEQKLARFPIIIDIKYFFKIAYNKIILGHKSG